MVIIHCPKSMRVGILQNVQQIESTINSCNHIWYYCCRYLYFYSIRWFWTVTEFTKCILQSQNIYIYIYMSIARWFQICIFIIFLWLLHPYRFENQHKKKQQIRLDCDAVSSKMKYIIDDPCDITYVCCRTFRTLVRLTDINQTANSKHKSLDITSAL